MADAQVRQRDAAVPMRSNRQTHMREDVAVEIPVDFWSEEANADLLFWTTTADRLRVRLGAGAYVVVGATRQTAVSLGAFTAGETKQGIIELLVPPDTDMRHGQLVLNVGIGYG
jgi:hypothetical protein